MSRCTHINSEVTDRCQLLIVEDNKDIQQFLSSFIMAEFGFEVLLADNGLAAIQLLENNFHIGIIITDIKMPEMDGIELLKKVKASSPHIDFIVITGFAMDYSFTDVINAGAIEYLTKPFEYDELKAKLCRVIRERNLVFDLRNEIEERQQVEEDLQKAHDFLEQRVAERTENLIKINAALEQEIAERKKAEAELQKALDEVKTLRGIIPICSYCKKIRDDQGYWSKVEAYVSQRTDAEFSHGICPHCIKRYFPETGDNGDEVESL